MLSLVLFGSLAGRVLMGWLADRWPRKYVMLLIYSIVAALHPAARRGAPLRRRCGPPALVFGVGLGGDYMIIPLMAADLFGLRLMGRVMGIVLTADGVAEAMVPMAVATIRDHAGSYGPGFVAARRARGDRGGGRRPAARGRRRRRRRPRKTPSAGCQEPRGGLQRRPDRTE